MKLALVAMPWSMLSQPSAAVGALAAYLRREQPDLEVACEYEYVGLAGRIKHGLYQQISLHKHDLGELLYMPLLYPEKRAEVAGQLGAWAARSLPSASPRQFGMRDWDQMYDWLGGQLEASVDELAGRLAACRLVGMTTCYGQLFANLALARRLRRLRPEVRIVLGGSTVSARVGPSILAEYPEVDFVIQGEGEQPMLELARALRREAPAAELAAIPGLLTASGAAVLPDGARTWEVGAMDALPAPDYDEYADLARRHGVAWSLPIEGSRGCWWDRVKRRGNARDTCYFCNLNVQWGGYREKSVDRVVREVDELTTRYGNTTVYFLDNIIRNRGVEPLAAGLQALDRDLELFYEMRVNIRPWDLLQMWRAGLRRVQIGIEGLSSSYLKRIGKGTTAMQNLEMMRTLFELGIPHGGNLIISFPGATADEVAETRHNILTYALPFEPCHPTPFHLCIDSTVDKLRDEFAVTAVRNRDLFRHGLPDEQWRRLRLFDLSYDDGAGPVDWTPVIEAVGRWQELQRGHDGPLLRYHDGGSFLHILDRRRPEQAASGGKPIVLRGQARDLYLFCMEGQHIEAIAARAGATTDAHRRQLAGFLDKLVGQGLMFSEDGRYLALAPAGSPAAAARRITRRYQEEERARGSARRRSPALPVVAAAGCA